MVTVPTWKIPDLGKWVLVGSKPPMPHVMQKSHATAGTTGHHRPLVRQVLQVLQGQHRQSDPGMFRSDRPDTNLMRTEGSENADGGDTSVSSSTLRTRGT